MEELLKSIETHSGAFTGLAFVTIIVLLIVCITITDATKRK